METFEYDMDEKGKTYKVKLWKTMGGRTIEKVIELPFKPHKGLAIRLSEEEGYKLESVLWNQETGQWEARCLTHFESILREMYIVQPRYEQKDYDERVDLHLGMEWTEKSEA